MKDNEVFEHHRLVGRIIVLDHTAKQSMTDDSSYHLIARTVYDPASGVVTVTVVPDIHLFAVRMIHRFQISRIEALKLLSDERIAAWYDHDDMQLLARC